jgi:protein subunit release factor B
MQTSFRAAVPCLLRPLVPAPSPRLVLPLRAFTTTPATPAKSLPPRTPLLDADFTEKFLHGSGPGGQKINKTSSAVQLKHLPTGIVVKYQDTRSRTVNRKMARKILQEKIEEMELGEGARTRVKAAEQAKRKRSADKKKRRKYRKIGEGGEEGETEGEAEAEGEELVEGEGVAEGEAVEGKVVGIVEGHAHDARKPEVG